VAHANILSNLSELLKEVYSSVAQHKVRSFLTGFGISWGIFILILLLGAGNGLRHGMMDMFSGYASNSIWVTGNRTGMAKPGGLQSGSRVLFNDRHLEKLRRHFPEIRYIASETGLATGNPIVYKDRTGFFDIKGISEDYLKIKSLEVEDGGRFFNRFDYRDRRRVVIIGERVKDILYGNENPTGKHVAIEGVTFRIVGILKGGTIFSVMEQNSIYAPDPSLRYTFNTGREYGTLGALLHEDTSIETFENRLRNYLSDETGIDRRDRGALYINNIQLQVKAFGMLFDGVDMFLWVLGLCFLLTGMLGIMNIMFVVVNERTEEIGIRKALGATPSSILHLIIAEALIITFCFGLAGIISGFGAMELYNWLISALQTGQQQEIFSEATIDAKIVAASFLLLIISGLAAGIMPARKAAKIMPVETLSKVV
jgi:putative ABC transport system permease protein